MIGKRPKRASVLPEAEAEGFQSRIPASFKTLEEARNSLDFHWNGCAHLFDEIKDEARSFNSPEPPSLSVASQRYLEIFEQWGVAFDAFLLQGHKIDAKSMQGARVLQISQTFAIANIHASPYFASTSEMIWDALLPYFQRVTALGEEMSRAYDLEIRSHPKNRPVFSLDMNVIAPLYAVSHKCRDPIVRRKALALLHSHPRQEGIWDSVLTARVAERMIKIEEEGLGDVKCCKHVPDWARMSSVDVKFNLEGRLGTVRYSREQTPCKRKREDVVVVIEW